MDKDFMNFLINLDKEKSQSEKMRVNQAYGIYHDIVESENKFCFIIDDDSTEKVVCDMTASDAISFIKTLCKCSDNEVFKGELLMLACSLIKENYDSAYQPLKKFFWNELSNVLRAIRNDKKMPDYFLAKILSISTTKFIRIVKLLSAIKETEGEDD